MLENRLTCFNSKLQKRKWKLSPNTYVNNAKAQIDYILMNKKCTLSFDSYSPFEGPRNSHGQDTSEPTQESIANNQDGTLWLAHA